MEKVLPISTLESKPNESKKLIIGYVPNLDRISKRFTTHYIQQLTFED